MADILRLLTFFEFLTDRKLIFLKLILRPCGTHRRIKFKNSRDQLKNIGTYLTSCIIKTLNTKTLNTYVLSHDFFEFEFSEVDCIYSGPCALQLWSEENLQGHTYRAHTWHFRTIFNSFQIKSLENYGDCCWNIFR